MTILAVLTILALAGGEPAPASSSPNRWAEPTRGILAQHCGPCHLPNLPTSIPRAMAVFNLSEEPWYGRLTNDQLDSLLHRVRSIEALPELDRTIVESFVSCARDRICPQGNP